MAMIVTVGGADSNSFVTVEEATAMLTRLYPEEVSVWNALETDAMEQRLSLAAELFGYLSLRGRKVYCNQALPFPRTSQAVFEMIPEAVKESQADMAFSVIHRALLSASPVTDGQVPGSAVTQVSLGGLLMVSFSGSSVDAGTVLDRITRSVHFKTYTKLRRYITQIRGGSVGDAYECLELL